MKNFLKQAAFLSWVMSALGFSREDESNVLPKPVETNYFGNDCRQAKSEKTSDGVSMTIKRHEQHK